MFAGMSDWEGKKDWDGNVWVRASKALRPGAKVFSGSALVTIKSVKPIVRDGRPALDVDFDGLYQTNSGIVSGFNGIRPSQTVLVPKIG